MEATITEKIMTFFDNIDDMLNNYVDKVELIIGMDKTNVV